jgi:arginine-tRNA-protein transferase
MTSCGRLARVHLHLTAFAQGGTSFHRTYMLREPGKNEPRPLAVGMLDVLPRSISSNYFIWDPAYAALSLGVVSALDEIGYVASRAQREPHFRHYYIGYYVPNNQRMRYKLQYDAAELFCPIMKQWVPKDRAVEVLRHNIYAPLTLRELRWAGARVGVLICTASR